MKKDEKWYPTLLSEVAVSNEVTILNLDGTVKRVGKYREMFNEVQNHDAFYIRLAFLIKKKQIMIK